MRLLMALSLPSSSLYTDTYTLATCTGTQTHTRLPRLLLLPCCATRVKHTHPHTTPSGEALRLHGVQQWVWGRRTPRCCRTVALARPGSSSQNSHPHTTPPHPNTPPPYTHTPAASPAAAHQTRTCRSPDTYTSVMLATADSWSSPPRRLSGQIASWTTCEGGCRSRG